MEQSNKRIAKNTMFLYARMLLIMVVSLFTSRIVLQQLGVEDFGIHNVVGGLVTTLSFLSTSIAAGTSRFYAFYLGKKDNESLNKYFKLTVTCYIILGIFILVVAESLGLWFVNTQLAIPEERIIAANWVYQCSIASFIISMFIVPYRSMIIANENMSIYAYVGIVEVVLKLGLVYLLSIGHIDKLILYALLLLTLNVGIGTFYIQYSKHTYKQFCRYQFLFEWQSIKELVSYSVWIIFGSISGIIRNQGINILLNIFFGPVVNAARGIAYQVHSAVNEFVNNFYMAARPQITKRYAAGEKKEMYSLVFSSSKLCFYLIIILAFPIIIQTPIILGLWLKTPPDDSVLFTRLILITAIVESIAYPLDTSITSTGNIRGFQLICGGILILNLPVAYLFLKIGYGPESTMIVAIVMALIAHLPRMYYSHKLAGVPMREYILGVLVRISYVGAISFVPLYLFYRYSTAFYSFMGLVVFTAISFLWTLVVIYLLGINKAERISLKNMIISKIHKS